MKHSVFSTSIKILIVTLILLAVCLPNDISQYLMVGAAVTWLAAVIGFTVFKKTGNLRYALVHQFRNFWSQCQAVSQPEDDTDEPVAEEIKKPADPAPEAVQTGLTQEEQNTMLCHIALRITEKLQSAYSDATWQWQEKPELKAILNGQTVRVKTDGIENNTHADICFDRYARVNIKMLIVEDFAAKPVAPNQPEASIPEAAPDVVDVRVWYDLIGRGVLEALITDLNAKGHSRLSIKENGDIVIMQNSKEMVQTHLDNFPAKNYWNELINIFKENELKATARKDSLGVSWV